MWGVRVSILGQFRFVADSIASMRLSFGSDQGCNSECIGFRPSLKSGVEVMQAGHEGMYTVGPPQTRI